MNNFNRQKLIFTVCIIFIICIFLFSYFNTKNKVKMAYDTQFIMGTYIDQEVYSNEPNKVIDEANKELMKFDEEYSYFIKDSIVSIINDNAGIKPVKLTDSQYDFFKRTLSYSQKSNGIFDVTIAPINDLWNVLDNNPKVPTEKEINERLKYVNYKNIQLDDNEKTIFLKNKDMKIDLGGIAKGEAINIAKNIYDKYNVHNGYISIGGNIYVYKGNKNNEPLEIGLKDPFNKDRGVIGYITLKDQMIATSGGYERFFEKNGKVYHHIMDPRTGKPSDSDLKSVSIISTNGAMGDMLSTYFFITGSSELKKHINSSEFSFIAVLLNGDIIMSNNMKDNFKI